MIVEGENAAGVTAEGGINLSSRLQRISLLKYLINR